jgi:hypothetical protein
MKNDILNQPSGPAEKMGIDFSPNFLTGPKQN